VCSEMRRRLDAVRARTHAEPAVSGVLVVGHEPGTLNGIMVAGPGTFLHDLIEVAGGRNAFGDLSSSYGVINKEALLLRAPQVIVELAGEGGSPADEQREAQQLWDALGPFAGGRRARVCVVEATYALIPGPRVVELAERLAEAFHPGSMP